MTTTFQVICLNKNNDAVKVLRETGESASEIKERVRKVFALNGAPTGTTSFRVVPLR